MSVETEFRALLAGHAPLTALVGTRIAQDAAPEGSIFPLVEFSCSHNPEVALDGTVLADQCALAVNCWATTGAAAAAVADAVVGALATAPVAAGATVIARATAFDADQGADGVQLSVEWWA